MKYLTLSFLALFIINPLVSLRPAQADQFKLPEEIGRVESPRDTNIFQIEPTVIDERYYTSGRCERHQFVGSVLPEGSPIPDTDAPIQIKIDTQAPVSKKLVPAVKTP